MATVRFASQLAMSAALSGFCLSATLCYAAKPTKANQSPETTPALPAAPVPKAPARLVFADPYPSPPEPPAPDQLLSPAAENLTKAFTYYSLGALSEESGETETALGYFQKALNLDPGNVPLAIQLATHFVQIQNTTEALRILKDAQQARPANPDPLIEIARVYLTALHQPDNALGFAEKAYKLAPDRFAAISIFVEVCTTAKLSQKVDDVLKKTDTLRDTDPSFWLQVGDLFRNAYSLRSPAPAKATSDRINGLFKKALDLAPNDSRILERVADHYALSRQLPEASSLYERAQSIFVKENKSRSPIISQKWARALAANDRINGAIEILEELLQEQPSLTSARSLAGEYYLQIGQLITALGHLRFALETDPTELEDHVRVIQLQLRLRRAEEAVSTSKAACKLFPDSPTLTMLLAVALAETKNSAEAVVAFERAEKLFTSAQREALNAEFYLTYGAAAERAGLLEKAAVLLKKSISLAGDKAAEALNYLGYMWIDHNMNLEEAGELIQKALDLRPNHPAYLDSLGWWFYRKGDLPAALQNLRKAVENMRREDAGEVYDHLGDVLEKLNQPEDAVSAWEAAVELDASMTLTKEKIVRLKGTRPPSQATP